MAGFGDASGFVRFVFALFLLAVACGIIGLSSPAWSKTITPAVTGGAAASTLWTGLWDACTETKHHAPKTDVTVRCTLKTTFYDWEAAVRAFGILGLLSLALAGSLLLTYVCCESAQQTKEVTVGFILVFFFSCICFVVSVGTFGGKYMAESDITKAEIKPALSWAFGLTVAAGGLSFLAAIFSIPELQFRGDRYSDYSDKPRESRRHIGGSRYPSRSHNYPERQGSFGPADRQYELNKVPYQTGPPPNRGASYRY